jgi:hypothetical protein
MSALGHSRPSHFVPVLNNVRYASDSDHSRYESELTLWAKRRHMQCNKSIEVCTDESSPAVRAGCKVSVHSHRSRPLAPSVLRR